MCPNETIRREPRVGIGRWLPKFVLTATKHSAIKKNMQKQLRFSTSVGGWQLICHELSIHGKAVWLTTSSHSITPNAIRMHSMSARRANNYSHKWSSRPNSSTTSMSTGVTIYWSPNSLKKGFRLLKKGSNSIHETGDCNKICEQPTSIKFKLR